MNNTLQAYKEKLECFQTERKRLNSLYVEQTKALAKTKAQLDDVTNSINDIQDYIEVVENEQLLRGRLCFNA